MRKFLIFSLVVVNVFCYGQRTGFHYVAQNDGNKHYASFFKKDSIKGFSDIWVKSISSNQVFENINKINETEIKDYVMMLVRCFCAEKKYLVLSIIVYENKSVVAKQNIINENGTPEYVIPNTVVEAYYDFACNNKLGIDWDLILKEDKK